MKQKYPHLFSPIQIGSVTLKDRIIAAPTGMMDLTPDGRLTVFDVNYYEQKARGGAETSGRLAYGPSEENLPTGEHVCEMSREMIEHIVNQYAIAAKRVKDCGFDMLMVHAAHGWLFNQFLSPVENHRTDEFGGSLENRARFLIMAVDAVRRAVGPHFPIELRLNGDDFIEGALHLEDYCKVAQMLQDKVDMINVSAASHEGESLFVRTHPHMFLDYGCNVYLAAEIKKHVHIPVAAVGTINTPELAEEIIASGKADMVEIGRQLIADPYFPKKAQAGHPEDITPCLRCYHCFDSIVRSTVVSCAVNPVIGHELDCKYYNAPVMKKKKVMVAGGGPGGMEAAITAAKRGHEVILCDNTDSLGGALKFAEHVPFKRDLYRLMNVLKRRVENEKIDVRLNTLVDRSYVEAEEPDVLIVGVGAEPIIPPIKGIHGKNVVLATNCEADVDALGQRIAILGGGLIGAETGINLAHMGKTVTIIEMRESIAANAIAPESLTLSPIPISLFLRQR